MYMYMLMYLYICPQDLSELSEGLEGRSSNPVALLFDALTHPDADLGAEMPSCLTWQKEEAHFTPHIVLGKSLPGGAWQVGDFDSVWLLSSTL